jgi:hypothetical protein
MSTNLDDLVDAAQAAQILGMRKLSVVTAIRQGRIHPARKIGSSSRATWITTLDALARFQARKDAGRKAR